MKEMLLTSVSSVWSRGAFALNRTDSNFDWSAFSWDRSDSAAHAKH